MVGAFETKVTPLFWQNLRTARRNAMNEAAITAGLVLRITCIRINPKTVEFIGDARRDHFYSRLHSFTHEQVAYCKVQLENVGHFHTTWRNITTGEAPIGCLVVYPPINIIELGLPFSECDENDSDIVLVNSVFQRHGESLSQKTYGTILCDYCGRAIDQKRLSAVPNTKYCINCMTIKENWRV